MAVTNVEVQEIIEALRKRGGQCTLRELAKDVDRNVNGLSQTLNSAKFKGLIDQGDGRGGDRIIMLNAQGSAQMGEQLSLLKPR